MGVSSSEWRQGIAEAYARQRGLLTALASLSENQFNWRSGEDWSVGQCVEHLLLTNEKYLESIQAALATERATGRRDSGRFASGFIGRTLTRMVGPESKAKVPVPKPLIPSEGPIDRAAVERLDRNLAGLEKVLEESGGLDLRCATFRSPFAKWMKLRVGDAFKIIAEHNERHLQQAVRVTQQPDYPTG